MPGPPLPFVLELRREADEHLAAERVVRRIGVRRAGARELGADERRVLVEQVVDSGAQ